MPGGSRGRGSFDIRRRSEVLERLPRLGEEVLGVTGTALRGEPLAVLELDDGEVERELELAQRRRRRRELVLGLGTLTGEARTEAVREAR